jgi:hypothetical protein
MKDPEEQRGCFKFCLKLAETFTETFQILKEPKRRKRHEGWRNKIWVLHCDNAPPHMLLLVCEFLANNKMTVVPNRPTPQICPLQNSFFLKVEIHYERLPNFRW